MAWSYDATNLDTTTASGRLNIVRLLVGDTDTTDQQIQDEEITFALSAESDDVYGAASWIAKSLAAKYSRFVDIELDGQLAENYSQLREHYQSLSNSLKTQSKTYSATLGVKAGGIKISEMETAEELTDRVKPSIRRDQFLNKVRTTNEYEG